MNADVTLPLWAMTIVVALAAWTVAVRLILPALRWFVAGRSNVVLEEVSSRLRIGVRPFQRTRRQVLIHRLLGDPKVQAAVERHAAEHQLPLPGRARPGRALCARDRARVQRLCLLPHRQLGRAQGLARASTACASATSTPRRMKAVPENATVVFVMNHRSNMDYILASHLAVEQAALSYAVGEWARTWPLSALIRSMGAYFVRRNSKDELYRRVLECYVAMATQAGVPQAVFPEGGLTRDGLLREPRLGVIDYMLRGFALDGERDLVFLPLGLNYDRVLEDRTLLLSADPNARKPSRFWAVWNTLGFVVNNVRLMLKSDWRRFGYACVNFGTPVSMRAYCAERGIDFQKLAGDARRRRSPSSGRSSWRRSAATSRCCRCR